MKFHKWSLLSLLLILMLMLAACGGDEEETAEPEEEAVAETDEGAAAETDEGDMEESEMAEDITLRIFAGNVGDEKRLSEEAASPIHGAESWNHC